MQHFKDLFRNNKTTMIVEPQTLNKDKSVQHASQSTKIINKTISDGK